MVKKIILIIRNLIKDAIIKDVSDAGIFSIELDSTQDISAREQCPLVMRFVKEGKLKEELVSVIRAEESTSGECLFKMMTVELAKFRLSFQQCEINLMVLPICVEYIRVCQQE